MTRDVSAYILVTGPCGTALSSHSDDFWARVAQTMFRSDINDAPKRSYLYFLKAPPHLQPEHEKSDEPSPECMVGILSFLAQTPICLRVHRRNVPVREMLVKSTPCCACHSTTSLTSSRIGTSYHFKIHLPVAIVPCRTKVEARRCGFWSTLPPSFCFVYLFPMRYSTHAVLPSPLTRNADNWGLLVLMPYPTMPIICVSLETRVVPNIIQLHEIPVQLEVVSKPVQHLCVSLIGSQEVQAHLERQRRRRESLETDRGA